MKPIGKYIVVKTIKEKIKTESGILLTGDEVTQMRYERGLVIAPGTDVHSILEGDEIYYDKSHGFTMIINEVQHTIIRENDVVVVL